MNSNLYVLRHKSTGLFYNGTCFCEVYAARARLVPAPSVAEAVLSASYVWGGCNIEAIPMAPDGGVNADAVYSVKMSVTPV